MLFSCYCFVKSYAVSWHEIMHSVLVRSLPGPRAGMRHSISAERSRSSRIRSGATPWM